MGHGCHGVKAISPGYLCSKYENLYMTRRVYQDMDYILHFGDVLDFDL